MPIEYRLDSKNGILYCTAFGRLTGADIFDTDQRMRSDTEMRPEFHQISDFRRVDDFAVQGRDLMSLAWTEPYFSPTSRRAVVAKGPLALGMTRMFELQRGEHAGEIRIFETMEEAESWVGEVRAEEPENPA